MTAARRVRPGRRPQHTRRRRRHRRRGLPGDERGNPHLGENPDFKDASQSAAPSPSKSSNTKSICGNASRMQRWPTLRYCHEPACWRRGSPSWLGGGPPWPPCHGPPAHDAAYGQAVNGCPPHVVDNVSGPSHGRASGRTSLRQGPTRPRTERADTAMRSTVIAVAIRLAISASLAVSGAIHVYLYVNGYRDIPIVGPGFLGQAIVFCVLALLILAGGPDWLRWVAGGAFHRRTGRVRAVAHGRALRIRRSGMEPITVRGGQRDRRSAHRGIRCRLCAEQPHQNPITLTALTPGRRCDNGTIVRSPRASISFTDPPESLPLCRSGNAKAGG